MPEKIKDKQYVMVNGKIVLNKNNGARDEIDYSKLNYL